VCDEYPKRAFVTAWRRRLRAGCECAAGQTIIIVCGRRGFDESTTSPSGWYPAQRFGRDGVVGNFRA
jgi:hypothetical protein